MFYILTFSYAVVVIGPLLLCLLVPGTIAECGLALTYMSAFKSTTRKKKKKKKVKGKDEEDDDDDEEEEEEEKGKKYRWSNHIALSRRLTELTREHFEGLFYDWSPPPLLVDSSEAHSSSASPSSSSSPNENKLPPNPQHQAAALWLRQTDHLLVQSTPDWPSLISLRNGLQAVEGEQGAAISSLQRSLLTVQKALLPLISAARRQQRRQQQQQPNQQSSSQHLSHHSSDLLEQSETLLRGWCRRVKALKTLHV